MKNFQEYLNEFTSVVHGSLKPQRHVKTYGEKPPTATFIHKAPRAKTSEPDARHSSGPLKPTHSMPVHTPSLDKSKPRTSSVPGKKPGGQYSGIGKLQSSPKGCPGCGTKTIVKLDHTNVPGHKGTNRYCPECSHKWLQEPKKPVHEDVKTPFNPEKLKGESFGDSLSRLGKNLFTPKPEAKPATIPHSGDMYKRHDDMDSHEVPTFKPSWQTLKKEEMDESAVTSYEHPESLRAKEAGFKFGGTHHVSGMTTHNFYHANGRQLQLRIHHGNDGVKRYSSELKEGSGEMDHTNHPFHSIAKEHGYKWKQSYTVGKQLRHGYTHPKGHKLVLHDTSIPNTSGWHHSHADGIHSGNGSSAESLQHHVRNMG
jgi:hypothetical protein